MTESLKFCVHLSINPAKFYFVLELLRSSYHGGESRDILHLYSDETGKNIRHCFFNIQ